MNSFLLRISLWVRQAATRKALILGQRRINDFKLLCPGVLEEARAKNKVLGFYVNRNGGIDHNYHLFHCYCEARDWACRIPCIGAKHAIF